MTFTQRAEAFLELPGGSLSGEARVEILGKRQLTVDGACDILAYEPSCIRLKTRSGELRIHGDRLNVEQLYAQGALIGGCVLSIEFL